MVSSCGRVCPGVGSPEVALSAVFIVPFADPVGKQKLC